MNKLRILIIDDEKFIHETLYLVLDSKTSSVDSAFSEADALSKIKTNNYDVLICDYNLGTTKGTDLILKFREDGFNGKIVMLTGNSEILDLFKVFKNEVSAMFSKPFTDINEFIKNLEFNSK